MGDIGCRANRGKSGPAEREMMAMLGDVAKSTQRKVYRR